MGSFMRTWRVQPVWPTYVISQSGQGIRFTTPFCWSEGTGSFEFTRMWDRVWWCLKYVRVLRGVRTHLIDSERFRMYGNSYNCGHWWFCIGTSASAFCYQSLAGISVWIVAFGGSVLGSGCCLVTSVSVLCYQSRSQPLLINRGASLLPTAYDRLINRCYINPS